MAQLSRTVAPSCSQCDVDQALKNTPVDKDGHAVDHRTGLPLKNPTAEPRRGWRMVLDAETGDWVAQNPGAGGSGGFNLVGWVVPGVAGKGWEARPRGYPRPEYVGDPGDFYIDRTG